MDPALSISSPFHNAVQGKDGIFDDAIDTITNSSPHVFAPQQQIRTMHSYSSDEALQGYDVASSTSSTLPNLLAQNSQYPLHESFPDPDDVARSNRFADTHLTPSTSSHRNVGNIYSLRDDSGTKHRKMPPSHLRSKAGKAVLCAVCDQTTTFSRVPDEGIYICSSCFSRSKERERPPRSYPTLTFKCCPTATAELEGGVVRCSGCRGWYHQRCVGITSDQPLLSEYVSLTSTKWYCPEQSCSGTVLSKQVKQLAK